MPVITLKIGCEEYISQWYINEMGGASPVKIKKNSPEQHILRCMLINKAEADLSIAPEFYIEIVIPEFKGMPSQYFNALSTRGQKAFIEILKKRFDLQLFSDLAEIINVGRKDETIWAWMDAHGIELTEKNWFAVSKRLKRMIDRINSNNRVKNFRSRKKNI